jgi:hypothetical protein
LQNTPKRERRGAGEINAGWLLISYALKNRAAPERYFTQLKPQYKHPAFTKAPLPLYLIQEEMKRLFSVSITALHQAVFTKLEHHPKVVRIP